MQFLPASLCLLIGAAGWFYAFYSRAATNLRGVEMEASNLRRVRLRRAGGLTMLLLAAGLYVGIEGVDAATNPPAFVAVWIGVMVLMKIVVILGLIDLRLTHQLRSQLRELRDRNKP